MESFVHHSLRRIIARCDMGHLLNGAAVAPTIYVSNTYIDYSLSNFLRLYLNLQKVETRLLRVV